GEGALQKEPLGVQRAVAGVPPEALVDRVDGLLGCDHRTDHKPHAEYGRPMAAAEVSLPPGPRLPRLLLTLGFLVSPARFLDACRRRYGDVVWLSTAFDAGFVMVFDPDVLREVFRAPPDRLRAGEANAPLGPLLGERSVLLLDGAEHLRQRRLLLPPFHGARLQAHESIMREAADAEIDRWPRGDPFALLPPMQALTDEEVRDELVTLLVAGHETTATGLAWTFDLLLHAPRVLERAREGDPEYLDAVVKESLRVRPVVPGVGRVVRGGPFELAGYVLPPGVEINPSIRVIHRRADRYPSPREFRPERFLGPDAPDTYTSVPFGGGTRRCLAASF